MEGGLESLLGLARNALSWSLRVSGLGSSACALIVVS